MLQRGPSLRPFVHFAAFLLAETSVCGRSGLLQLRLLLAQHLFAHAARELRRRSDFHRSSHSNERKRAKTKPHFRRTLLEIKRCGTKWPYIKPEPTSAYLPKDTTRNSRQTDRLLI
jgi:hypothetical protein